MWCRNCEQDVPGVAVPDDPERICCARCNAPLSRNRDAEPRAIRNHHPSEAVRPSSGAPRWRLRDDLAAARRFAETAPAYRDRPDGATPDFQLAPPDAARPLFNAAGAPSDAAEFLARPTTTPSGSRGLKKRGLARWGTVMSWLSMMLGATALAFGGVVSLWPLFSPIGPLSGGALPGGQLPGGAGELWAVGWPMVLGGQLLLLLGLLSQFEGLLRVNRRQHVVLKQLDREVRQLRHDQLLIDRCREPAACPRRDAA